VEVAAVTILTALKMNFWIGPSPVTQAAFTNGLLPSASQRIFSIIFRSSWASFTWVMVITDAGGCDRTSAATLSASTITCSVFSPRRR